MKNNGEIAGQSVVMLAICILAIPLVFFALSPAAAGSSPYVVKKDTVLAEDAVGPSWIAWKTPCLTNADLVYVDRKSWNLWVMDEHGGNKRCLTGFDDNIMGVNFPLDEDGQDPKIHWKGDPEAHPFLPVIIFKAENEHSSHRPLGKLYRNSWR